MDNKEKLQQLVILFRNGLGDEFLESNKDMYTEDEIAEAKSLAEPKREPTRTYGFKKLGFKLAGDD